MEKLVAANHFSFGVGEERERVATLAAELLRDFGSIDADGDGLDSLGGEFGKRLFDTS